MKICITYGKMENSNVFLYLMVKDRNYQHRTNLQGNQCHLDNQLTNQRDHLGQKVCLYMIISTFGSSAPCKMFNSFLPFPIITNVNM